jgi:hypothetical protein
MLDWQDVILGVAPALAWSGIWIQFVTVRFFDKPEVIFKDWVTSGAKDLAISNIESSKLVPALADLCDSVAALRAEKTADELRWLSTADVLTEVDFLAHLERAESALREKGSHADAEDDTRLTSHSRGNARTTRSLLSDPLANSLQAAAGL